MEEKRSKKSYISIVLACITVCLALIFGAGYFWFAQQELVGLPEGYHAVFLSNGQVYFGQYAGQDKGNIEITSIYYLQIQRTLQGDSDISDEESPDLSLTKLGNELHGPTDSMLINREHIMFVEKLRPDSKVVQAIQAFRGN